MAVRDVLAVSCEFSPSVALTTAHHLLVKWDVLSERDQLWSELRATMSVLGKAIAWQLPARLRLVGVVVQVVDALTNPVQAPAVIDLVREWLWHVKRQQRLGKIDPLGLLKALGRCMEGSDLADSKATPDAVLSEDLEMQIIEAARAISLHLQYDVLEKALVAMVVSKNFGGARLLVDELELLCQFVAQAPTSSPVPASTLEAHEHQMAPAETQVQPAFQRRSFSYPDISTQRLNQSSFDPEVAGETQDMEETLAAMLEMGSEVVTRAAEAGKGLLPSEAVASVAPTCKVQQHGDEQMIAATGVRRPAPAMETSKLVQQHGDKRKCEVLDGGEEICCTPLSDPQPAPSRGRSFSGNARKIAKKSLRNPLFDDSIQASPVRVVPSSRRQWTSEEQQRLTDGHRKFGGRWEFLRQNCQLQHLSGMQLKDKWANLIKSGRVKREGA